MKHKTMTHRASAGAKMEAQAALEVLVERLKIMREDTEIDLCHRRAYGTSDLITQQEIARVIEQIDLTLAAGEWAEEALTDESAVLWLNDGDPKWVRFGDLDRNAQKTVERGTGRWVGGFPF